MSSVVGGVLASVDNVSIWLRGDVLIRSLLPASPSPLFSATVCEEYGTIKSGGLYPHLLGVLPCRRKLLLPEFSELEPPA